MARPSMSTISREQSSRHNSDPFNEKINAYYEEPTSPIKAYIPRAATAAVSMNQDEEKAASRASAISTSSTPSSGRRISAARVGAVPAPEHTEGLAKTLIYLSTINPLVTVLLSFFSILSTPLIFIFGIPHRLGKDGLSFGDQLIRVLAPAIRYELRLIQTDVNLFSRSPLSASHLTGVLLLSPLFSVGIMVAAWTAATFWMYTTILGEPDQKQGKEVDGKSAARWVKRLWVRWLLLGL